MTNQAETSPGRSREGDTFGVVMRGYDRRQVDEFVARARHQIRDLGERLARALNDVEASRAELNDLRLQVATNRPVHEEVSERLAEILRLAEEEAAQKRAVADETVVQIRAIAEEQAQRMVNEAGEEAERTVALAREEADRVVSSAQERADREVSAAREEAERALTSSRDESERTLASAQERAAYLLADAERRAAAINVAAGRRMESLTRTHSETVARLSEIRDALGGALAEEAAAGTVEDSVQALIASGEQLTAGGGVEGEGAGAVEEVPTVAEVAAQGEGALRPEGVSEAQGELLELVEEPAQGQQQDQQQDQQGAEPERTIDLTDGERHDSAVGGGQR